MTARISATRRLQFAIGHRVYKHEGKCAHLHGHNFVFFLTVEGPALQIAAEEEHEQRCDLNWQAPELHPCCSCGKKREAYQDPLGRVLDFGVMKERLGGWLELTWDHGFVLWEGDDEAVAACRMVSGQKLFLLSENPTAENLAKYLLEKVGPERLAGTGVTLTKVVVWETENGIAEASL